MTVSRLLCTALVTAAVPLAGCGDDGKPVRSENVPAVTSPGTTIPYETGGADGSGADGRTARESQGGTAAGRDAGTR